MDYKYNKKTAQSTITRDMSELDAKVGNVYESVAIIAKRANEISADVKKSLDAKLQEFTIAQDNIDEVFINEAQITISRGYELIPKPTLIATQEFIDDELIYRNTSKDKAL